MEQDDIVVGLHFGDEGKGRTTSALVSRRAPKFVVRFSGGPQTAHNVIHDGIHHTFAQLGSGTLQRIPTILTRFMLTNPFNLMNEGATIIDKTGWNPFNNLLLSENSLLITPIHRWMNHQKEIARGAAAHGSCGEGIGETRLYELLHPDAVPVMGDLLPSRLPALKDKLAALLAYAEETIGETWEGGENSLRALHESYVNLSKDSFLNIVDDPFIAERLNDGYNIWEGSQGVLLDESLGFFPHTTWSRVTPQNAQTLLAEAGKPAGNVVGVTRTYFTRHGAGPFPSEVENTEENRSLFPEAHNTYGRFQGGWRRGWFDVPLFEYAVRAAGGVDELSVTHADRFFPGMPIVMDYPDVPTIPTDFFNEDWDRQEEVTRLLMSRPTPVMKEVPTLEDFYRTVEEVTQAPVRYVSTGPETGDYSERR